MKISILQITICFLIVLQGCVSVQRNRFSNDLFPELKSDDIVAVSTIYDALNGDITNLGNRWRGKIENILAQRGITVKARKDIIFLIDEAETFENGVDENKIWQEAGADIIIRGAYTILSPSYDENNIKLEPEISLSIQAYRLSNSSVISSEEFKETLAPGWASLASFVHGNIYQKNFETITPDTSKTKLPELSASLNKKNTCYKTGENAVININTESGVYIYIFNIAADRTVSLLYPNKYMKNKPLSSKYFRFPPLKGEINQLELYPLEHGKICRESFKIIASKEKLDFSFLPFPEGIIYAGAKGGDINKMIKLLKQHTGFNEALLTYWVGRECK